MYIHSARVRVCVFSPDKSERDRTDLVTHISQCMWVCLCMCVCLNARARSRICIVWPYGLIRSHNCLCVCISYTNWQIWCERRRSEKIGFYAREFVGFTGGGWRIRHSARQQWFVCSTMYIKCKSERSHISPTDATSTHQDGPHANDKNTHTWLHNERVHCANVLLYDALHYSSYLFHSQSQSRQTESTIHSAQPTVSCKFSRMRRAHRWRFFG